MRQGSGVVVPLGVIAHRRGNILCGVQPLHAATTFGGISDIAGDDEDWRLVAISVVDRHGGVLDADGSVRADQRGLAFDLGVAVGGRRRALFVRKGDELGIAVAAVIDHRFVNAAETRSGRGEQVFESERFEDVDHVVRARALDNLDVFDGGSGSDVFSGSLRGGGRKSSGARSGFLRLGGGRGNQGGGSGSSAGGGSFEKASAGEWVCFGFCHGLWANYIMPAR